LLFLQGVGSHLCATIASRSIKIKDTNQKGYTSVRFTPGSLPGLILIEPKVFGDERGFFMETFQARRFAEAGIDQNFVQDNHSGSGKGTLRGLHYQIRQPQGKLVRVVVGEIFDVAVDLRRSSSTFGKWEGFILSAEKKQQLWIPPGFAHGFYVTSSWAEVIYKASDYYAPEWERTLLWNDPDLGIVWPLAEGDGKVIISPKDAQGKRLYQVEVYP
jgi:dTDP-4-dehydrorhamnose 3,5-epimerase